MNEGPNIFFGPNMVTLIIPQSHRAILDGCDRFVGGELGDGQRDGPQGGTFSALSLHLFYHSVFLISILEREVGKLKG